MVLDYEGLFCFVLLTLMDIFHCVVLIWICCYIWVLGFGSWFACEAFNLFWFFGFVVFGYGGLKCLRRS